MQNVKYHAINLMAVLLFSYTASDTIGSIAEFNLSPDIKSPGQKHSTENNKNAAKNFDGYKNVIESGFFRISDTANELSVNSASPEIESIDSLILMGTITGPASIARAIIKKKGEKELGVFALYNVNNETGKDVYGYKLTHIDINKVFLESNGQKSVLKIYDPENNNKFAGKNTLPSVKGSQKKNISRAEIKQKVLNNLDNAMKGLVAGPYRKNGKIVGFRLKKVRPYNILYKFGARSGDIIKRINGKALNSTEKLYKMWQTIQNESKVAVDLERRGQSISLDLNITD